MELTFAQQSAAFLYSFLPGILLGTVYGALKVFRRAFKLKKPAVITLDIIFMLLCALVIFYFCMGFLDGYIRIYVFFGASAGFFVYRCTIGKLLCRLFIPIVTKARCIIAAILTKFKLFAKKLLKIGCKLLYNVGGRIVLFIKRNLSTNLCNTDRRKEYGKKRKGKGSAGADRRA